MFMLGIRYEADESLTSLGPVGTQWCQQLLRSSRCRGVRRPMLVSTRASCWNRLYYFTSPKSFQSLLKHRVKTLPQHSFDLDNPPVRLPVYHLVVIIL